MGMRISCHYISYIPYQNNSAVSSKIKYYNYFAYLSLESYEIFETVVLFMTKYFGISM
jgi:hypothetical protein